MQAERHACASSLGLLLKSCFSLQPASSADIWRWVHSVYGDELGLTSDDEHDYVSPYVTPEGKGFLKVSKGFLRFEQC